MRSVYAAFALAILLGTSGVEAGAQTITVSATSVDLPVPDTLAYDSGLSASAAFTAAVVECGAASGCRVTLVNPLATSAVPLDLEWRLVSVDQTGTGSPGCTVLAPLDSWQPLGGSPVDLMDTAFFQDAGTGCVATVEVRASNLDYSVHEYTTPSTTYWRDLLFRVIGK